MLPGRRLRVPPLSENEWTAEQRELLALGNPSRILNVTATLARHVDLYRSWVPLVAHILTTSTLTPREREIVILRIGWLCQSEYEFAQHTVVGKHAGLSETEIERIELGPGACGWSKAEQLLLLATDELHHDAVISDETWARLGAHFDTNQVLDLIFTTGHYAMLSMALNSLGVQLEEERGASRPVYAAGQALAQPG